MVQISGFMVLVRCPQVPSLFWKTGVLVCSCIDFLYTGAVCLHTDWVGKKFSDIDCMWIYSDCGNTVVVFRFAASNDRAEKSAGL